MKRGQRPWRSGMSRGAHYYSQLVDLLFRGEKDTEDSVRAFNRADLRRMLSIVRVPYGKTRPDTPNLPVFDEEPPRRIVFTCNYCLLTPDIRCVPEGRWRLRGMYELARPYACVLNVYGELVPPPREEIRNGRAKLRDVVVEHGELTLDTALFEGDDWRGYVRKILREKKEGLKCELVRRNFYPFDTDGRNVNEGDYLVCDVCKKVAWVLEMTDDRRLKHVKWFDTVRETVKLFEALKYLLQNGEYEAEIQKLRQERDGRRDQEMEAPNTSVQGLAQEADRRQAE